MKIRMKLNLGRLDVRRFDALRPFDDDARFLKFSEGSTHDVSNKVGALLVENNWAEQLDIPEPTPEPEVEPEPSPEPEVEDKPKRGRPRRSEPAVGSALS